MLNQFRVLYPQGSIISELAAISNGKYVVRVLLQIDGVTLATGLAAAETVEQAEDRARDRALAIVNLNSEPIPQKNNKTTKSVSKTLVTSSSITKKQENNHLPNTEVSAKITNPINSVEPNLSLENQNLEGTQLELVATDIQLKDSSTNYAQINETENQEISSSDQSDDFSDVIARTNLELKRLNWTNEQGRDYLLQTYGKRSRQLLSDEELLEFLHYLETQP